ELTRGKSARVQGHLNTLLVLMKGQPLAYNRDNQEDKIPMFDTADTVGNCVALFADMAPNIIVKHENCREAARRGYATATDLADYLVRAGVPFRDAHEIVGNCVSQAIKAGCDLAEMPLSDLQSVSPVIGEDVYNVL